MTPCLDQGFDLWKRALRWRRAVDACLAPFGLTHTQCLVLLSTRQLIAETGDAVSQKRIALRAGLTEATTSVVMRALVGSALVDRGPTYGNPHEWRVILTRAGEEHLDRAAACLEVALAGFFV